MALSTSSPVRGAPRQPTYAYRSAMGMMSSAEFFVFHDDFTDLITTNLPLGWQAAIIDTGATIIAGTGVNAATGALYFDSDGAAEGAAIYKPKVILLTAGKKFFMETRFLPEAADDIDFQFGLTDLTATTNPEDLWTTTAASLITFGVLDSSAVVGMLADAANSGTTVQAGDRSIVADVYQTLGIFYDGSRLHGYLNGKKALTWSGAAATIPTGVALAPFVGYRNGSAATNECHVDYVRYVMER